MLFSSEKIKTEVPASIGRRAVIQTLIASSLPIPVIGSSTINGAVDDEPNIDPAFFAQLQSFVRPALLDINAGRLLKGISGLEQARELMKSAGSRNWFGWFYVNQPYGLALVKLGRFNDAIEPLTIALDTEKRIRASESPQLKRIIQGLDSGIVKELTRVEYARQVLSNVDTNGAQPLPLKLMLLDHSPGTMDCAELLVNALANTGESEKAEAVLKQQLTAALEPWTNQERPRIALEYRLFKMGVSLSGANQFSLAGRAFDAALNLNFERLRYAGTNGADANILQAIYNVRRLMLSAALGNVDFEQLDADESRRWVLKVMETKGLGIRYSEHFYALVARIPGATADQARQLLKALDSQLEDLPSNKEGLVKFFSIAVARWQAVAPLLPELKNNGLGEIFKDGIELLAKARSEFGKGVMLGYMAYTPIVPGKFEFSAPRYLRYCIVGNDFQLTDIGPKTTIDQTVLAWRQKTISGQSALILGKQLTASLCNGLPSDARASTTWTIEPDGCLGLLPFEALPDDDGAPLIMSKTITYVTAFGRTKFHSPALGPRRARIIADPDFGPRKGISANSAGKTLANVDTRFVLRRALISDTVLPLPETRAEAKSISDALRKTGFEVNSYMGRMANRHAFDMTQSPQILHVATHGMLLEQPEISSTTDTDELTRKEFIAMAMPGRNAALVVSGSEGPELLLASELSQLPLQDTELAVLSACDSGNGTVDVGEGIAGLRRSLEIAGARSSITSLWAVPSLETTKVMSSFYNHLASGLPKRDALRQAKLESISRNSMPLNWAAFVLAGQE